MKAKPQSTSILLAACLVVFLSLTAFARPANPPQDQRSAQTRSGPQDRKQQDKQKGGTSPGKDVGKGGEDIGRGAAKGAGSLGRGTAGAAGNLATLHPGKAGADLGKGAAGAGKNVGVGAGKGAAKIGEGSAKGIEKSFGKVFHRSNKDKAKEKSGK